MAEVVQDTERQARIDGYLDYLIGEWASIPEIAAEWQEWENHEQLEFVVGWPLREDKLHQVQQWADQKLLTPDQRAHYSALMTLVAEYRTLLKELLKD